MQEVQCYPLTKIQEEEDQHLTHHREHASDIEVVGEGSLRVNAWLKQVAGSSEEGASE